MCHKANKGQVEEEGEDVVAEEVGEEGVVAEEEERSNRYTEQAFNAGGLAYLSHMEQMHPTKK
jgi:hypothetical protein